MIYHHITELIGNTPLLKIDPSIHGLTNIDVYAKLEYLNPFGSVKDRPAWEMLRHDLMSIQQKNQQILESSSGNTAKALALLASVFGLSFKTMTNRMKVAEQRQLLHLLGAQVEELPGSSDCYDPFDPNDPSVFIRREIAQRGDQVFHTSQYTNEKNVQAHYHGTGREIIADLSRVVFLFGGLGTTGSTMGIAKRLKERDSGLRVIGICAQPNDYLPGIRNQDEMWEVGLFDPNVFEAIEYISSQEGIEGSLDLAKRSGILGGPTSGACYRGMLRYLGRLDRELTERKTAVFIVCDRLEWYLSYIRERRPDVFAAEDRRQGIDTLEIEEVDRAPRVTIQASQAFIEQQQPLIVDMRGPQSFQAAHIKGSVHMPESVLKGLVASVQPFSRTAPLLFVCPKGERSQWYAAYLKKRGYEAYNLDGGLYAWREHGLPLERAEGIDS